MLYSETTEVEDITTAGSAITTLDVEEHPLASVTVAL
jgi:hypothetical protein